LRSCSEGLTEVSSGCASALMWLTLRVKMPSFFPPRRVSSPSTSREPELVCFSQPPSPTFPIRASQCRKCLRCALPSARRDAGSALALDVQTSTLSRDPGRADEPWGRAANSASARGQALGGFGLGSPFPACSSPLFKGSSSFSPCLQLFISSRTDTKSSV
jgi:hypothetical protein